MGRSLRHTMLAALLAFVISLAGAVTIARQLHPKTPHRHPEAAKHQNPVPATPESIAAGKRAYSRMCVRCHGPAGKGDGGGSGAGGQPADFTDDVWEHGESDGEIYAVIHDGVSADMDSYAERIPENDIWNLVNFLKSIGPQPAANR